MISKQRKLAWILAAGMLALTMFESPMFSISTLRADDAELPAIEDSLTEPKLNELIQQLGAEEFADRERAQTQLSRLGLEAFDALHQAQYDEDVEISLRARYLIRAMNVQWFSESDPIEVVRILKGYGEQSSNDRRNRMDRMAALPPAQGLAALCRLVRFETDNVLSKHAALLVLGLKMPTDEAERDALAKSMVDTLGPSNRSAAAWVRTFAKSLRDPESTLPEWSAHTVAEHETLTQYPERTSRDIVRDLYRWQVELLRKLGKHDEMLVVIRRTIPLVEGIDDQLQDMVDWLMQREAWSVIKEIATRFPDAFKNNAVLLYRLAETKLREGDAVAAEATANQALALKPENLDEHIRVGFLLQEQGLREWAEREYREVIKASAAGSVTDFRARFYLSEMLHDLGEELAAAQALEGICDLMDKDPTAKEQALRARREPNGVYARMHYFFARHWNSLKDVPKERDALVKAVKFDPTDADVLIGLYRLPEASDEIRSSNREQIETATKQFREQMEEFRQAAEQAPNEQFRREYDEQIASACNQLAWLVSNTFGDFNEALEASKRSLELRPDTAGYLDTLARCHYAKKDLAAAIAAQKRAVELDPHSGQLKRQLKEFEAELAAQPAKP